MKGILVLIGVSEFAGPSDLDSRGQLRTPILCTWRVSLLLMAAVGGLGGGGRFAEQAGACWPAGAGRMRGRRADPGDRRGKAADNPGGGAWGRGCQVPVLVPLPLAGLGQHPALLLAGELGSEVREHDLLLPVRNGPAMLGSHQAGSPARAGAGQGSADPFLRAAAAGIK